MIGLLGRGLGCSLRRRPPRRNSAASRHRVSGRCRSSAVTSSRSGRRLLLGRTHLGFAGRLLTHPRRLGRTDLGLTARIEPRITGATGLIYSIGNIDGTAATAAPLLALRRLLSLGRSPRARLASRRRAHGRTSSCLPGHRLGRHRSPHGPAPHRLPAGGLARHWLAAHALPGRRSHRPLRSLFAGRRRCRLGPPCRCGTFAASRPGPYRSARLGRPRAATSPIVTAPAQEHLHLGHFAPLLFKAVHHAARAAVDGKHPCHHADDGYGQNSQANTDQGKRRGQEIDHRITVLTQRNHIWCASYQKQTLNSGM